MPRNRLPLHMSLLRLVEIEQAKDCNWAE